MTETPDRWQALRDALEGHWLPPGPWERREALDEDGKPEALMVGLVDGGDVCEVDAWLTKHDDAVGVIGWPDPDEAIAAYIATADPSTVGALLAERDALLALVREPAPGPCLSPCPASPGLPLWCELRWGHKGGHEATNTDGSRAAWTEPS